MRRSEVRIKAVLSVDNLASMRQMMAVTLNGAGYKVIGVVDDIESMDMPRMDGLILIKIHTSCQLITACRF